ncbi:hypothetical protein BJY04DRAFT_191312 [Aspergillus karnatakaensis]|uniref:uncharacterized protein n=1 Tax=Aspergillus karnatakaensis TaxID=1810916 RepID=UPI003CCE529A
MLSETLMIKGDDSISLTGGFFSCRDGSLTDAAMSTQWILRGSASAGYNQSPSISNHSAELCFEGTFRGWRPALFPGCRILAPFLLGGTAICHTGSFLVTRSANSSPHFQGDMDVCPRRHLSEGSISMRSSLGEQDYQENIASSGAYFGQRYRQLLSLPIPNLPSQRPDSREHPQTSSNSDGSPQTSAVPILSPLFMLKLPALSNLLSVHSVLSIFRAYPRISPGDAETKL